jgi:hypothetical protein
MSLAAERIRELLNAIELSQPHLLLEETDYNILKNAVGGKELFKFLRQKNLTNHLGDFQEAETGPNGYPSIYQFGIAVGDSGCAFLEYVGVTYSQYKTNIWVRNNNGELEHNVKNANAFAVKELVGPNTKFFTTGMFSTGKGEDDRLKSRNLTRVRNYSKNENLNYNFKHIIFYNLIPVLVPILKKSLLDSRDTLKDAFARGDYAAAESLSKQLNDINSAIVDLGPTERITLGVMPHTFIRNLVFDAIEQTFNRIDSSHPGKEARRIEWGVAVAKGDKKGLAQIIRTIKQKLHVR